MYCRPVGPVIFATRTTYFLIEKSKVSGHDPAGFLKHVLKGFCNPRVKLMILKAVRRDGARAKSTNFSHELVRFLIAHFATKWIVSGCPLLVIHYASRIIRRGPSLKQASNRTILFVNSLEKFLRVRPAADLNPELLGNTLRKPGGHGSS